MIGCTTILNTLMVTIRKCVSLVPDLDLLKVNFICSRLKILGMFMFIHGMCFTMVMGVG